MTVFRHACLAFLGTTFLVPIPVPLAVPLARGQAPVQHDITRGHQYFVDCSSPRNGSGDSPESPWKSLDPFQSKVFSPADVIQIRRGTECQGVLAPKGSGAMGAPIRLTAYGEGARPSIIAPSAAEESFRLFNQEYWEIDSLDLSGGRTYGIFISGDKGILHHIHLKNLAVHDVVGGEMKSKDNGLVLITPGSVDQHFDDVLVDGVTAWHTQEWMGIMIGGGKFGFPPESTWSTNVVIRNSMIHDVQGDGIVLFRGHGGKIESSVAWNTGMQATETTGTPNAIWTWMCHDCTVEQTEAFLTDSPGVDGGAYDIDYGNTNNAVLDNYGHDTQGYCVAVFGAGFVTRQSTVRGNLCINNGRSPRMAKYQGAIFLLSWNDGSIDGLTIDHNTVYASPYERTPALINNAQIAPGTAVFRDNTIYSSSPWLSDSNKALSFENNHYSYFGAGQPEWRWDGKSFDSLGALQSAVQQERGSSFIQHPLKEWPAAFSQTPPNTRKDSVFEQNFSDGTGNSFPISRADGRWHLYSLVPVSFDSQSLIDDDALRQIVFLKSLDQQYRARGLQTTLLLGVSSRDQKSAALRNAVTDLDLAGMPMAYTTGGDATTANTILVSPQGEIVERWNGFAGPAALGLAVRTWLGEPAFSQMGLRPNE
jgi:Right handed beta helix region